MPPPLPISEERIAALERRLLRLAASAPGVMFSYRRLARHRGHVPYISPTIEALTGLLPEDIENDISLFNNLIHPDDRRTLGKAIEDSALTIAPYRVEFRLRHKNQGERWIEARAAPEREVGGGVLWHGFMVDITEQKQSQQQLELVNFALDRVRETVLCFDGNRRLVHANASACSNLGYSASELLELDVFDIVPKLNPENIGKIERLLAENDNQLIIEGEVRHRNGQTIPVESSISAFHFGGRPMVLAMIRDITERQEMEREQRENEAKLRSLFELSPLGIALTDMNGRYLEFNEAFRSICAYPADELMQLDYWALTPKEYTAAEAEQIDSLLRTGRYGPYEKEYLRKSGERIAIQLNGTLISGKDGGRYIWSIVEDITERKQAEQQLRKSHDIMRALAHHLESEHEEERRQLAYQIHEDLAQNLAALCMNVSLLQLNSAAAPFAPTLACIRGIADRCIVRIRDMVSMLRPSVLEFGIVPALQWLAADFNKDIGFELKLALQDGIVLEDDVSTFLFRATQEALVNTALHAAATEVCISLKFVDGSCRLNIHDNGRGFDPAASSSGQAFGLLGLAEQAHHLNGLFSVNSSPGQGTLLEIQVPANLARQA